MASVGSALGQALEPWTQARRREGGMQATSIVYVAPHALRDNLADMCAVLGGERRCCIARELTKLHETFYRGSLDEVRVAFENEEPRGEIVLIVEGSAEEDLAAGERTMVCAATNLASYCASHSKVSQACAMCHRHHG